MAENNNARVEIESARAFCCDFNWARNILAIVSIKN